MNKKIIAILTVVTILFICIFASCKKEENNIYVDNKEYKFVTDENGEKVLAEDGRLLVYETNEHGRIVKDENGEPVTLVQQFQPIQNKNYIEDFGYTLTLPEGWKSTAQYGEFINPDKGYDCELSVVKYFYDDYYASNKAVCKKLKEAEVDVTWEENIEFPKEYKGICRFVMSSEEKTTVMYFFENSDNVYKILFNGESSDELIKDSEEFCKSMNFKPFAYYDDITERTTKPKAEDTQKATTEVAE